MEERGKVVAKQRTRCFLGSAVGRRRENTPDSQIALASIVLIGFVDVFLPAHMSGMQGHEKCNWLFKAFCYFQFQCCYDMSVYYLKHLKSCLKYFTF